MPRRKFDWGKAYLLTDGKELVFDNEPAICVGKHDSDAKRPTICAVCGEPLRSKDYYCFYMMGVNGRGYDMMIGSGCVRDRIIAKKMDVEKERSPKETLNKILIDFPDSGRWYGTFLHHCIAKPYVRNKTNAEKWDESVLKMPGVEFIMNVIDTLRDEGWNLDAEMHLDCGNVDLLATHPDKGTIVFDWKSDRCFSNKEEYIKQINRYMTELHTDGHQNISGYILWVKDGTKEHVPFIGVTDCIGEIEPRVYVPSPRLKCILKIDMDGGEGISRKSLTEYSYHRRYGDEVSFFIPPCDPEKDGYEFVCFEASPYKDGDLPQWFNWNNVEEGFRVTFICTKKKHTFHLKAEWKRKRPFKCRLIVRLKNNNRILPVYSNSIVGDDSKDYAKFMVSEINKQLPKNELAHRAILLNNDLSETDTVWEADDLSEKDSLIIPCIGDNTTFQINLETVVKEEPNTKHSDTKTVKHIDGSEISSGNKKISKHSAQKSTPPLITNNGVDSMPWESIIPPGFFNESYVCDEYDPAEHTFTPKRTYKSGRWYFEILERRESDRYNAVGMIYVREVNLVAGKISNPEWRHIYTKSGKEYFYGLSDHKWKVYTNTVTTDKNIKM